MPPIVDAKGGFERGLGPAEEAPGNLYVVPALASLVGATRVPLVTW